MEAAEYEPLARQEAYKLLGPASQRRLEQRTKRAEQVLGRRIDPSELLAPGTFGLKFRPQQMVDETENGLLYAHATGDKERGEDQRILCDRTGDVVRMELPALPDLPPSPGE